MKYNQLSIYGFILAQIFSSILSLGVPIFVINVYDKVLPASAFNTLAILSIAIGLVLAVELVFKIMRDQYLDLSRSDLLKNLIANYPLYFWDNLNRNEALNSLNNYNLNYKSINEFENNIFHRLKINLESIFCIIFIIIVFLFSIKIGIAILSIFLISLAINIFSTFEENKISHRTQKNRSKRSKYLDYIHFTLWNFTKSGVRKRSVESWSLAEKEKAADDQKNRLIANVSRNISSTLILMAVALTTILGAYEIDQGTMTIGALIGINILTARILSPCRGIASYWIRSIDHRSGDVGGNTNGPLIARNQHDQERLDVTKLLLDDVAHFDQENIDISISGYDLPRDTKFSKTRIYCDRDQVYCLSEERGSLIDTSIAAIQLGVSSDCIFHINGISVSNLNFEDRKGLISVVTPYSLLDSFVWEDFEYLIDLKNPLVSQCYNILNIGSFSSEIKNQKKEKLFVKDIIPEIRRDMIYRLSLLVSLIDPRPVMFFDLSALDISSRSYGLLFSCIKRLCPASVLLVRSNRPDVFKLVDVGIVFENRKLIGYQEN
jgi:hypothetical protein